MTCVETKRDERTKANASRSSLARIRTQSARARLADCHLCEYHCGINRLPGEQGVCHAGADARFFSAQIKVSDELEVIPTFAVALCGCDLRCDFCITGKPSWNARDGEVLDVLFRKLTSPLERRAWGWAGGAPLAGPGRFSLRRAVRAWLERRLPFPIRIRNAGYSFRVALGQGLKAGLPFAAVMAATMPVWGMSWYFDTENWAAGIWDSWAASRTDAWREAMTAAVPPAPSGIPYAVAPPGIDGNADFSFLIVGDPGEGDPSQHILRDQILFAAARADVRFVVISSDVIYPAGAMKDYERKFWLPMKRVTRPVYAIPLQARPRGHLFSADSL